MQLQFSIEPGPWSIRQPRFTTTDGLHICTKCGEPTEFEDLAKNPKCVNGRAGYCQKCYLKSRKVNYRKNAKQINQAKLETTRRWHAANREHDRECTRKYRLEHPDYAREYEETHKEQRREYMRGWDKTPKGREKNRTNQHRRRAQADGENYTSDEFKAMCAYYENRCLRCGRDDVPMTADHVVALSNHGSNGIKNIQPLCSHCNKSKRMKTIDYRVHPLPDYAALAALATSCL